MADRKRWRLICYDIREPARLRKVHRLVRGAAQPLQYSVYRAWLTERELERLRWELSKVLSPSDSLMVIDLCPMCAGRVIIRNPSDGWDVDEPSYVIVSARADHGTDLGGEGTGTFSPDSAEPTGDFDL